MTRSDSTPVPGGHRRWLRVGTAAAVLAILLGITACSANRDASSPSGGSAGEKSGRDLADTPANGGPADGSGEGSAPADGETGGGRTPALPTRGEELSPTGRSIVYVADLTVRVSSVDNGAAEAVKVATRAGGTVAGDQRNANGPGATATLLLRIPPERFSTTVDALAKLGTQLDRSVRTDDVTEAVVDLDSRITSQQSSVDRVRLLFGKAQQIADIVVLERELGQREAELAALLARKRQLSDQVTMSTITLTLRTDAPAPKEPDRTGFLAGLSAGWSAFISGLTGLLTAAGALLPFLVLLAVIVLPPLLIYRRRLRVRTTGEPVPRPE